MNAARDSVLRRLWRSRALIQAFAKRDISTRYRSSALGWGWSLAQPLATLVIFSLVFTIIFKVQAPPLGNGQGSSYAAFFFTGLVTWNLFASLQPLTMNTLKSVGDLLRKVHFPAWTPLIGAQIVQLVQVLLEVVVLMGLLLILRNVGWTWLLAIPILIGTMLFAQGIGMVLALVNAKAGDVMYIVTVGLGVLYFLTPILYPMSLLEGQNPWLVAVVKANPMSWYVQAMHDAMYSLVAPPVGEIALLVLAGAVTFWLGLVIFDRFGRDIGEQL